MDADNNLNLPLIIPNQLYQRLQDMDPEGAYGILYDIYTGKTEDDLLGGWNARRGESIHAYVYYFYFYYFTLFQQSPILSFTESWGDQAFIVFSILTGHLMTATQQIHTGQCSTCCGSVLPVSWSLPLRG